MNEKEHDLDDEIAAIATISGALSLLENSEARRRVISYVLSRYLPETTLPGKALFPLPQNPSGNVSPISSLNATVSEPSIREIPGIVRITESGEFRITARDLKAKSGLDAAIRLAYIAIYASEKLIGEPLSSAKTLTPLLKSWRLYNGNTRARLAKDRGIIRSGEYLSLDAHAKVDTEQFFEEILNPEVQGSWRP